MRSGPAAFGGADHAGQQHEPIGDYAELCVDIIDDPAEFQQSAQLRSSIGPAFSVLVFCRREPRTICPHAQSGHLTQTTAVRQSGSLGHLRRTIPA